MFLPTVWLSFFGVFTMVLFLFPMDGSFIFSNQFRFVFLASFIVFMIIIYFTLFSLKRVEFNPDSWTTTNYLKTFQYSYNDIDKISIFNIGVMRLATIHLKEGGSFGTKLKIILNNEVYRQFQKDYPDLLDGIAA